MTYFGGFGIHYDFDIFKVFLDNFKITLNKYDIVGFNTGANLALNYATNQIEQNNRVGKVILLSPLVFIKYTNLLIQKEHEILQKYKIDINIKHNITHLCFEEFQYKYSQIPYNMLCDIFINLCLDSYNDDKESYLARIDRYLMENKLLLDRKKYQCRVFTHSNIAPTLKDSISNISYDLNKIAKKSKLFIVFIAENDRIINSKQIGNYFSQFGICYILKNYNHILEYDI